MEKFCIYTYNPNCQEWEDIRNSKLVGIERDNAFNECVKKIGKELSLQEYFSIYPRESDWTKGICYKCLGTPNNLLEQLAYSELEYDTELDYLYVRRHRPEDLIESRTSYEDMIGYADNLSFFIEKIKDEIANGTIKIISK